MCIPCNIVKYTIIVLSFSKQSAGIIEIESIEFIVTKISLEHSIKIDIYSDIMIKNFVISKYIIAVIILFIIK